MAAAARSFDVRGLMMYVTGMLLWYLIYVEWRDWYGYGTASGVVLM